ncbi:helix-turn-helix transcriptional regulator [Pelagibacterium sp. 26DY04]|uniref:helix-turn-helix domain-containing protein n=1 Tax=Pelagibacterium sp. 26DY04 TaxID=2967130 RepID=UPI002815F06E|nr:helix-turn-helix transcriptional regulator [Pelagibacterium sp. 26DY04]WMT87036.1 helix-turn-helix transcriptional regulator [Pelagibacterium sp. 26DY04]
MTSAVLAVGRNIRRVRERKGISREDFARALGTTIEHVIGWEAGQTDLDVDTLDRIVEVLGIKHRDLFD